MRTDEEILARIKEIQGRDVLGYECSDLILKLPFEVAKQFLEKGTTKEEYGEPSLRDRESMIKEITNYMPFAWEKANDCRGLSAGRSMSHFNAWIWLAGDDLGDLTEYQFYGKDNLVKICNLYELDHKQWDDGKRVNTDE